MSDVEPLPTEQALARTYDGGAYADAYEAVHQYRRATSYAFRNDAKSGATASATGLPRGRIRLWVDEGGAPDAVNAIEAAHRHGWLECEFSDPTFTGLNALVANVFSGGSIGAQDYRPSFALNQRGEDSHVIDALELVGAEYELIDDRDGRADEIRPTEDGTVLGRVLAALGAPVGPKTDRHLELPAYLEDAPTDVCETFVYAYLENRAVERPNKDTLTVREERNREYLESLSALIESVAGDGVHLGKRDIIISADAARTLGTVR
ncbi:hypothetical protein G6M89_20930 [Natronolimnobius sp. AArcel1]|uniref:hypothetical protein n=1 Tax=Natronolimnobius sp. AArcel1 TaxID=1679093 RepID=UPI0013EC2039|nr:hypothetical protein [Natronolimnobius sp. AArcel1]NGM71426.1 hypothetical protein [Natronolimnobius sp. AArcel1]